jgi:hypothetical protein
MNNFQIIHFLFLMQNHGDNLFEVGWKIVWLPLVKLGMTDILHLSNFPQPCDFPKSGDTMNLFQPMELLQRIPMPSSGPG